MACAPGGEDVGLVEASIRALMRSLRIENSHLPGFPKLVLVVIGSDKPFGGGWIKHFFIQYSLLCQSRELAKPKAQELKA
jgi:hypothetical protein